MDALNGKPGIYSARFAGEPSNAENNWRKLLVEMEGKANRSARFQCVLVFMRHSEDPTPIICQASWEGEILDHARGEQGHGYDPIFQVRGDTRSAAEMDADTKNRLSHRGKAMKMLLDAMKEQGII